MSVNSIDREGDRDNHDKNNAREGTFKEKEENLRSGEASSTLKRKGWHGWKYVRMIQEPKRGGNTNRRRRNHPR